LAPTSLQGREGNDDWIDWPEKGEQTMALKSLVPWRRGELGPAGDPFALHREIDDLFERF